MDKGGLGVKVLVSLSLAGDACFGLQVTGFEGIIFPGTMQRKVPFWWPVTGLKKHSFLTLCKERSHFGGIFAGKCVVKSKIAFGFMLHLHFDHLALATHVLLEWCADDFLFGEIIIQNSTFCLTGLRDTFLLADTNSM